MLIHQKKNCHHNVSTVIHSDISPKSHLLLFKCVNNTITQICKHSLLLIFYDLIIYLELLIRNINNHTKTEWSVTMIIRADEKSTELLGSNSNFKSLELESPQLLSYFSLFLKTNIRALCGRPRSIADPGAGGAQ